MATQGFSSIGVEIKVNSVALNFPQNFGDLGGTPSELDATCLKDTIKHTVPGVQDVKAYEVTYLYDNSDADSDYRKLKAIQDAGSVVPVEVTLPDKSKWTSTAYASTYVVGAKTDEIITAKLILNLQADWTVTNPTTKS
jgi:hypothetical protein